VQCSSRLRSRWSSWAKRRTWECPSSCLNFRSKSGLVLKRLWSVKPRSTGDVLNAPTQQSLRAVRVHRQDRPCDDRLEVGAGRGGRGAGGKGTRHRRGLVLRVTHDRRPDIGPAANLVRSDAAVGLLIILCFGRASTALSAGGQPPHDHRRAWTRRAPVGITSSNGFANSTSAIHSVRCLIDRWSMEPFEALSWPR
jgi:hypothetical protein